MDYCPHGVHLSENCRACNEGRPATQTSTPTDKIARDREAVAKIIEQSADKVERLKR